MEGGVDNLSRDQKGRAKIVAVGTLHYRCREPQLDFLRGGEGHSAAMDRVITPRLCQPIRPDLLFMNFFVRVSLDSNPLSQNGRP